MWSGAAENALRALWRLPDVIGIKTTVWIVTSLSEASAIGSEGAFARYSNTPGRLHAERSFRASGRFRKKARTKTAQRRGCRNTGAVRKKPVRKAAVADLYPRIVEIDRPLSKRAIRKSATSVRGAELGSTPWDTHQLKNPARREMYASRVDSRRLQATKAAARSERPAWPEMYEAVGITSLRLHQIYSSATRAFRRVEWVPPCLFIGCHCDVVRADKDSSVTDKGEDPVAGPVPISITISISISISSDPPPPPSHVGGGQGHRYGGLGDPQWVARAQEFRTAPPPEEEADRRGQGDPSG